MTTYIIERDYGSDGQLFFIGLSTDGFANQATPVAYLSRAAAESAVSDALNNGGYLQVAQQFGRHIPLNLPYDTALMMIAQSELY